MSFHFKTSIIICFYNRLDLLKCCLDSLTFNFGKFEEVVVADDGSSQEIVYELKQLISRYPFPIVHAFHGREGARRAATRNNGIRHAQGDYLVFLDADFVVLKDSLEAHLNFARPGQFVAGRVKYTTREQGERIMKEGVSASLLETIYRELPERPIIRQHREFILYGLLRKLGLAGARKQTFGGHFSVFKSDIEAVNGYDENYIGWGGEDQDIAHRLVLSGLSAKSAIREARVLHMWHEREMGNEDWKAGSNVDYYRRGNVSVWCENGLRKSNK